MEELINPVSFVDNTKPIDPFHFMRDPIVDMNPLRFTNIQPVSFYYEIWKPITQKSVPNVCEGIYYISNFGRVISYARRNPVYMTPTMTNNGYFRVCLKLTNNTNRYQLIHRILMVEFYPTYGYEELQVNHKDGDKSANYFANLEWMTCSENIQHAFDNGLKTAKKGEDCSHSTITNEQADQIAKLISEGKSRREIAEQIGCDVSVVWRISTGCAWKEVHDKYNLDLYKRDLKLYLSDEDLHKLCKYFEIHSKEYEIKNDLYRHALKDLFGIEYQNSFSGTLSRIYNKQTRIDITGQYNY